MSKPEETRRCLTHEAITTDPHTWSISRLAYIGDAVFELYIRMALAARSDAASGRLHGQSVHYVSAEAQAEALESIKAALTEKEASLVRRGRNAKAHSMPKHADPAVYRLATGFEALIGYLYLDGQDERVNELCKRVWEAHQDG
jgi:ribonuclease-3 family protein